MLFVEKHHSLDAKKKFLCSHKFRWYKTHNHKLDPTAITEGASLALARKLKKKHWPEPWVWSKTGRVKKKPPKKYISNQGGVKLRNAPYFGGKLSFILFWPPLSIFLSASTASNCTFTAPTCPTTTITLEPCALNAKFPHFIPRFNKISLLCGRHSKKG